MILNLLGRGYVERIMLSSDVCHRPTLKTYGGMGYTDLLDRFHGVLLEAGVSESDWVTMTHTNPARMLTRRS
jgi:phosphotriesterase-related protein